MQEQFFGEPAISAVDEIERSPPPRQADVIWRLCFEDVEKGFASPPASREEMDRRFGRGQWRPLVRFAAVQPSGKVRGIDDAKRTLHNSHSELLETIYTITVDWVPEAAAILRRALLRHWRHVIGEHYPDWMQAELATVDLPDAYRGCPVRPDQLGASVVAAWCPSAKAWHFMPLHGLAFGLSSAVVSFNRLPTLLVAGLRRILFLICGAYFDDLPLLDTASGSPSAMDALIMLLTAAGAPPADSKTFPPAQYRTFLGVDARVPEVVFPGAVTLSPLSRTLRTIREAASTALKERRLSSGAAAKLRGQLGWVASNSFGPPESGHK